MLLGGVAGLVAFATCISPDAAAAEVMVAGPRSCSRGAELQARVERALGRSLAEAAELQCSVHVVRDGGSYAARLEVSSSESARSRQRAFSAKTCPKLMDTLELAIVLALGAEGRQRAAGEAEALLLQSPPSVLAPGRRVSAAAPLSAGAVSGSGTAAMAKETRATKGSATFAAGAVPSSSAATPPGVLLGGAWGGDWCPQ